MYYTTCCTQITSCFDIFSVIHVRCKPRFKMRYCIFGESFIAITFRPTVLDNFALISSQINSLSRLLKSDKCPALRNYAVVPLAFSTEKDSNLEVGD